MTVDLARRLPLADLGSPVFVARLEPLPLIDPTAAAIVLGLERHTLACYRSLRTGPAYYKFGRSIRYDLGDIDAWKAGVTPKPLWSAVAGQSGSECVVDAAVAARYLTVTRPSLTYCRSINIGPRFIQLRRNIFYPIAELAAWVLEQRTEA